MKVGQNSGVSAQVFGTDETSGPEKLKQEKNQQQVPVQTDKTPAAQASPKETAARKSEQALAGQIQAANLSRKMDEDAPFMQRGSKGKQVEVLQHQLNEYRYRLNLPLIKEDGKYGEETEKAVRDFQQHNSLKPDGIIGPKTSTLMQLAPKLEKWHKLVADEAVAMQVEAESKGSVASYTQNGVSEKSESLIEKGRKLVEWASPIGPSVNADPEMVKNLRGVAESIVDKSEELAGKVKRAAEEVDPFRPIEVDSTTAHKLE